MSIFISIIIATNDSERYLRRCLDSIQAQKNKEIELIVVDNISQDYTLKILEDYQSIVDVLISEKDFGIYDAWNKGLRRATGKWILFMGSDDQLLPNVIKVYQNIKEKIECFDYVAPVIEMVLPSGIVTKKFGKPFNWDEFKYNMNLAHVSALHNSNFFKSHGLFDIDYKICGDYELLLRKNKYLKVYFLNHITAQMQTGGISQSNINALWEARRARKARIDEYGLKFELRHLVALTKFCMKLVMRKENAFK